MLNTAIDTLKDQEHKTRIGTAIFWTILSIIFIAGGAIPPVVVGALLLVIGVLTASKQVNIGNLKMPKEQRRDKIGVIINEYSDDF